MRILIAAAALLLTAGCGTTWAGNSDSAPTTPHAATHRQHPRAGASKPYKFDGHGANVSKRRFGKSWPLTVASGRVNCIPLPNGQTAAVFTANNDTRYALNGSAKSAGMGFKSIRPIWANDPRYKGLKKDISPLTNVCRPLMD